MIVMHITILLLLTHRAPFCHSMQNNNNNETLSNMLPKLDGAKLTNEKIGNPPSRPNKNLNFPQVANPTT
jgi:hypothetical protein